MIEMIKKLFKNETVRYIFFGGCTTLVNLVSYAILRTLLGIDTVSYTHLDVYKRQVQNGTAHY